MREARGVLVHRFARGGHSPPLGGHSPPLLLSLVQDRSEIRKVASVLRLLLSSIWLIALAERASPEAVCWSWLEYFF